jgi:hypothetical protein
VSRVVGRSPLMKLSAKPLAVLSIAVVVLVFVFLASLPRPGSRTRAFLGIINTLRQIDGAKQQYAIEHQTPPETVLSREQLLHYLPERYWDSHAIYKIKALSDDPEAVLPTPFDSFPAGTIIRLQTNAPGYQIIPPNHSAGGNAELALRFAIEREWLGVPQPGCSALPSHNENAQIPILGSMHDSGCDCSCRR